ncbi:MAG: hypothetical protein U0Q12_19010 [Vicinamibacterales bacterium]
MSIARVSISIFALVAVLAGTLGVATIWLLLTDPVSVATAVNTGEVSPIVRALADALVQALRGLLRFL